MKKGTLTLSAIIVVLLIANICEVIQIKKYRATIEDVAVEAIFFKDLIKKQSDDMIIQLKSENISFDRAQNVTDENGNEIRIGDIIEKNSSTLVVRLSKLNCQTCNASHIKALKEILSENDFEKVIFLLKYDEMKEMYQFKKVNRIRHSVYKFNDDITPVDKLSIPYFFCLTKEGVVNKVFIPQEFNESTTKSYLREVLFL